MARYSKTLTPAAQAGFLAALEGGVLIVAAARSAGVAVSSLYCRRHRDAAFAEAWEEAVAWSSTHAWRPLPGRPGRLVKRRRTRFVGWRREVFLAQLALTCDLTWAAETAGVDRSAAYRALARDPGFARAAVAAMGRGFARLERLAVREREAEAARLRAEIEPVGELVFDFDKALRLMRRWERPDGSIGPRFVRHGRQKGCTFGDAMAMLDRRLRGLGIPIAGEDEPPGPFARAGLA